MSTTTTTHSADYSAIVETVRELRAAYLDGADDRITEQMELLRSAGDMPVLTCFVEEMSDHLAGKSADFRRTRDAAMTSAEPLILGQFQADYNPELSIECIYYERVDPKVDPALVERHPYDCRPIKIISCTDGFEFADSVALFPENFVTAEAVDESRHRLMYFVDRFVKRCREQTRPMLAQAATPRSFRRLMQANANDLDRACSTRVQLHEFFHRTGPLPLPGGLSVKSTRSTGAFEEVRVDVSALVAIQRCPGLDEAERELLTEYILSERLFYAVGRDPQENYDARSSQVLYLALERGDALSFSDGRIDLDHDRLPAALAALELRLRQADEQAGELPTSEAQAFLADIVGRLGNRKRESGTYVRLAPYDILTANHAPGTEAANAV